MDLGMSHWMRSQVPSPRLLRLSAGTVGSGCQWVYVKPSSRGFPKETHAGIGRLAGV